MKTKNTCQAIARAVLGEPTTKKGPELLWPCPNHGDEHPSLSVNANKDAWLCGPCGRGGNAWALASFLSGIDPENKPGITGWMGERGLLSNSKAGEMVPVAEYIYRDEVGSPVFKTVRYLTATAKTFRQFRADGNSGWLPGLAGVRLIPYRLNEWKSRDWVCVVEGEKCADVLWNMGVPATCNPMGAGKWRAEYNRHFAAKQVVVLPDNDRPGETHASDVVRQILPIARAVKIVRLPDLPPKGDIADYISKGGTRAQLLEIVKAAAPVLTTDGGADAANQSTKTAEEPVGVLLSSVAPEKVSWLWRNRIPLGKLTMLDGDPGFGKSLLTTEIAARLSRGEALPGGDPVSGGAVILTAEDGLGDTVVPRLIASSADRDRIVALRYEPEHEGEKVVSDIVLDLQVVAAAVRRVAAKLVIVDVLVTYLPGETNSNNDKAVRQALAPLSQMASRMGFAVIAIRHLNKTSGGNAIYRGGGTIGMIGAARAGLLLARDPEDPSRVILAQTKNNLGPPAPSLAYGVEEDVSGAPRIMWHGESTHTANSLLAATVGDDEERGALAEAKEFLVAELGDGKRPQKEIQAEAHKAGIADATIRRAKAALGVKSRKDGFTGKWCWELPPGDFSAEGAHDGCEGVHISRNEHLRQNWGPVSALTAKESDTSSKVLNNTTEMSIFADDLNTFADEDSVPEDSDALEI